MGTIFAMLPALGCASRPRRDPDQSTALYDLGWKFYEGRRVEAAIEQFNNALKADPDNADAYFMLGTIALNQGHDYVEQAETADCLHGRDAELVRQDASRKFRDAEQSFRHAVDLRPSFAMAWNNLAVAELQLQEWDAAIAATEEALKDPSYASPEVARANLGWAYFQKREGQRAWKELHEAVARAPGFCVARYRLAKVYVERGDMEQAAENVDAVVNDSGCPIQEAFLLGGLVHQRRKEVVRARALFGRCADMAPRSCVAAECKRYGQLIQ
jgi:type IV pilus assembly protein PilF